MSDQQRIGQLEAMVDRLARVLVDWEEMAELSPSMWMPPEDSTRVETAAALKALAELPGGLKTLDMQGRPIEARARIERFIATKPATEDGRYPEGGDFWEDVMLLDTSSYGGQIDEDFCLHMEALLRDAAHAKTSAAFVSGREPEWRKLRRERGWPEGYQTLWNMILSHAGMVDWGTSIRGVWFEFDLEDIIPAMIQRFRAEP